MSFQFRFATLLRLHRQARDEAGADVGKASEAIGRIDDQTESLIVERSEMLRQAGESRKGSISIDAVLSHGRYDVQLQADVKSLRETRSQLEQELQRRQQALVAAESEVKRFERLEENELAAYRAERLKREQAEADEASSTRYIMERRQR